jgi:REP element-mobilizing transposase RayT
MIENQHQSNLRIGRTTVAGMGYFITKCVHDQNIVVLYEPEIAVILINSFQWMITHYYMKVGGFAIMPEHYHLILAATGSKSLSQLMRSINQYSGRKINSLLHRSGKFWAEGFYDHAFRIRRDYEIQIKYIHDNPVKKGLCKNPEEYLFSSANNRYNEIVDWDWFL